MSKPIHLYHGSAKEIEGEELLPRQAHDLSEVPENLYCAVYATDIRDIAIARAIIRCKGVHSSTLMFKWRPCGLIYNGWPEQEHIYLYTLPSDTFKQEGGDGAQWHSLKPVKPSKIERISVLDNIHLIRKATDEEIRRFFERYRDKIPSQKHF